MRLAYVLSCVGYRGIQLAMHTYSQNTNNNNRERNENKIEWVYRCRGKGAHKKKIETICISLDHELNICFQRRSNKNSEYDQEIPQSQTADNPMAPRGRAAQPSRDTMKTN